MIRNQCALLTHRAAFYVNVLVTCVDEKWVTIAPLPEDPVDAACGFLLDGPSLNRAPAERTGV
jgi:hypothetical protein